MRQSIKIILIFELLLIPFLMVTMDGVSAVKGGKYEPLVHTDGEYYYRIEEAQWEIKAFDLVRASQDNNNVPFADLTLEQIHKFEETHRVGKFEGGRYINFEVYSRDVQHGFSINEVGISIATNRPGVGELYGTVTTKRVQWPNKDITLSAFCHIFCGLGHPDMKMKFIIGEGSPEYGPTLYWVIIAINAVILLFVANKIWNRVE